MAEELENGEGPVKTGDQEIVLAAIERARRILGEYIEPRPRDAISTLDRLLLVLDHDDVVKALDHLNRRRMIRLVE